MAWFKFGQRKESKPKNTPEVTPEIILPVIPEITPEIKSEQPVEKITVISEAPPLPEKPALVESVLTEEPKPAQSTNTTPLTKRFGLSRLSGHLKHLFLDKKLDAETLEELEETLIMSDMGVQVARDLCQALKKEKFDKAISLSEVKAFLVQQISMILNPFAKPLPVNKNYHPHVILVCGVNGTGKTTTIGKLAAQYVAQGHKVMVAACDTFRAAAVEQLQVWSQRANVVLVTGAANADPASVAYEALEQAKEQQIDVILLDTAGRLQNKKNLMDELAKIVRVVRKTDETAPHDNIIVLDATTGQNAISQVQQFKDMVNISGMVITKLDGTAKGGILVCLAQKFGLPIHAVGIGEKLEDLIPFDVQAFSKELVGLE